MSIQQKLEKGQATKMVFEITAEELTEFVKQFASKQQRTQLPVHTATPEKPQPEDLSISNSSIQGMSKAEKDLNEKVMRLTARVQILENVFTESKEVLTLEETAVLTGMSKSSLYKMTHRRELPYYRPNGKLIYFERADILKWLRSNAIKSEEQIEEMARLKLQELAMKKKR